MPRVHAIGSVKHFWNVNIGYTRGFLSMHFEMKRRCIFAFAYLRRLLQWSARWRIATWIRILKLTLLEGATVYPFFLIFNLQNHIWSQIANLHFYVSVTGPIWEWRCRKWKNAELAVRIIYCISLWSFDPEWINEICKNELVYSPMYLVL